MNIVQDSNQTVRPRSRTRWHADQIPLGPPLLAGLIKMLHQSCDRRILGQEYDITARPHKPPVLHACWHFAFPAIIYHFRHRNGILMVSRSRDGEWIARVLTHLGYECVRGSPKKGGSTALRQMLTLVRRGRSIGLIADGSQGPARKAQEGVLLLARHTQAPLVPVSMAAHPCWRFRSWDRTVLAKPFSRLVYGFGPPLRVEKDAGPMRMEEKRQELERVLNELTAQCESAARG